MIPASYAAILPLQEAALRVLSSLSLPTVNLRIASTVREVMVATSTARCALFVAQQLAGKLSVRDRMVVLTDPAERALDALWDACADEIAVELGETG